MKNDFRGLREEVSLLHEKYKKDETQWPILEKAIFRYLYFFPAAVFHEKEEGAEFAEEILDKVHHWVEIHSGKVPFELYLYQVVRWRYYDYTRKKRKKISHSLEENWHAIEFNEESLFLSDNSGSLYLEKRSILDNNDCVALYFKNPTKRQRGGEPIAIEPNHPIESITEKLLEYLLTYSKLNLKLAKTRLFCFLLDTFSPLDNLSQEFISRELDQKREAVKRITSNISKEMERRKGIYDYYCIRKNRLDTLLRKEHREAPPNSEKIEMLNKRLTHLNKKIENCHLTVSQSFLAREIGIPKGTLNAHLKFTQNFFSKFIFSEHRSLPEIERRKQKNATPELKRKYFPEKKFIQRFSEHF